MAESLTAEELASYRAGTARRRHAVARSRREHWERAQRVARQAAAVLRTEFSATRVVVFGSGTSPARFGLSSDLDLAAWGIDERRYLKAVARLLDIDPELQVDLVAVEEAPAALRVTIETEGVEL